MTVTEAQRDTVSKDRATVSSAQTEQQKDKYCACHLNHLVKLRVRGLVWMSRDRCGHSLLNVSTLSESHL